MSTFMYITLQHNVCLWLKYLYLGYHTKKLNLKKGFVANCP